MDRVAIDLMPTINRAYSHDREHLRDAAVGITDQPADRGYAVLTERQFASGRRRQAHLVLQRRWRIHRCAPPGAPVSGSNRYFGTRNRLKPFGARDRADGTREHEMGDVLEQIIGVARR